MAHSKSTSVTLKLLVHTKGRKVLFAEATKEVVDFLFTLLSLPVGTVVRLLSKNCLFTVHTTVETATSSEGGYAKGVVTYMIMDNLVVKSMCLPFLQFLRRAEPKASGGGGGMVFQRTAQARAGSGSHEVGLALRLVQPEGCCSRHHHSPTTVPTCYSALQCYTIQCR
ncbi:unnamed protein product [Prunus armeniaca]